MKNILDLHTHTVLSNHAYSSLTENIDAANKCGLIFFGSSEHQPDIWGVGAKKDCFNAMGRLPRNVGNLTVLRGCEFNILPDGTIDLMGVNTSRLDYSIASMHYYAYPHCEDIKINTRNYESALDYDFVKILGHIHEPYNPCDFERIIQKVKEMHKLVELNNSKLNNDEDSVNNRLAMDFLLVCKEYNQPILVNSDAHICYEVGHIEKALRLLEKVDFPEELILNTNEELFKEYFSIQ